MLSNATVQQNIILSLMTYTSKFQIVIMACAFSIFGQIFGQKRVVYVSFLYFMLNTNSTISGLDGKKQNASKEFHSQAVTENKLEI